MSIAKLPATKPSAEPTRLSTAAIRNSVRSFTRW